MAAWRKVAVLEWPSLTTTASAEHPSLFTAFDDWLKDQGTMAVEGALRPAAVPASQPTLLAELDEWRPFNVLTALSG